MCTLTWLRQPDGYQVFMNRDERRSRLRASPPEVRRSAATSFIAPRDGDFGGTWIAVNEFGLSLCLLNGSFASPSAGDRISDATPGADYSSRGRLIPSLIDARWPSDAADRLLKLDLAPFRPFVLVSFSPDRPGWLAHWSGTKLDLERGGDPPQPQVSSSFCTVEVRKNREQVFRRMVANDKGPPRTEAHLAFHRSHEPAAGPHSVCMHRDDAETVSFSRIRVDPDSVEFHYTPDAPCRSTQEISPVRLARRV